MRSTQTTGAKKPPKSNYWWLSVEFAKKTTRNKHYSEALGLLDSARERYDLLLDDGDALARGIFQKNEDLLGVERLITKAGGWKSTRVYINGKEIPNRSIGRLTKMLRCAGTRRCCQAESDAKKLRYLGCHIVKNPVGLLGFSLKALKQGQQFWFGYFESLAGSRKEFQLKREKLEKTVSRGRLCPYFPDTTSTIVQMLPPAINLANRQQAAGWLPLQARFKTRWQCRYPAVVPHSSRHYEKTMRKILHHVPRN